MKFIHVSHKEYPFFLWQIMSFRAYVSWRDSRAENNSNKSCVEDFEENRYGKPIEENFFNNCYHGINRGNRHGISEHTHI